MSLLSILNIIINSFYDIAASIICVFPCELRDVFLVDIAFTIIFGIYTRRNNFAELLTGFAHLKTWKLGLRFLWSVKVDIILICLYSIIAKYPKSKLLVEWPFWSEG